MGDGNSLLPDSIDPDGQAMYSPCYPGLAGTDGAEMAEPAKQGVFYLPGIP